MHWNLTTVLQVRYCYHHACSEIRKKNQGKEPVVYSFTDLSNLVKWLSKKQVPNGIFVVGQEAVFWLQLEFKPVLASICTLELIIMLPLFTKKIGGMMNLGLLGLGSHVSFLFFFFPAQEPLAGTDKDAWTAGGDAWWSTC